MRAISWAAVLFLAASAAAPSFAETAQKKTDPEDCQDFYYGFGAAPDLKRAYACFEKQNIYEYLIVMRLNGQGTQASVAEAEKWLAKMAQEDPESANSMQGTALAKAIADKRDGAKKGDAAKAARRVDFCKDIAGDTPTVSACLGIESRMEEAKQARHIASVQKGLSAKPKAALAAVLSTFQTFKSADGERMYQQYIDGTIRGAAAIGQEAFVRERFAGTFTELVERKRLGAADATALKSADDELNTVYKDIVTKYEKDNAGNKGYVDAYKEAAKKSQRAWIKYRDAWAAFATAYYAGGPKNVDPEKGAAAFVTKVRITELKNDPVGPG